MLYVKYGLPSPGYSISSPLLKLTWIACRDRNQLSSVDVLSFYASDDGASMLLFDRLSETAEFARRWVPFCKKHNVEPRAPKLSEKKDYLKNKVHASFVKGRGAMKVS
ncbi:hypothetical protein V6N13_020384 [Hibiscus sabdariffa]